MSLTISVIAILYHAATSYFEMKKEGLSFCEYFQSLLKMGAGLPLRGIAHNTLDIVDLENVTLLDAQGADTLALSIDRACKHMWNEPVARVGQTVLVWGTEHGAILLDRGKGRG